MAIIIIDSIKSFKEYQLLSTLIKDSPVKISASNTRVQDTEEILEKEIKSDRFTRDPVFANEIMKRLKVFYDNK